MGPRSTVNGGNLGRHVAKARSAAPERENRSETMIERFLFLTTALHTCKMVNGGTPIRKEKVFDKTVVFWMY